MLAELYWLMSYSRWYDPRFWPQFRDEILRSHPGIGEAALEAARSYNHERYRYQGVSRYEPSEVYERGIKDLQVLANLLGDRSFLFGEKPHGVDAAAYGFIANIYFY